MCVAVRGNDILFGTVNVFADGFSIRRSEQTAQNAHFNGHSQT